MSKEFLTLLDNANCDLDSLDCRLWYDGGTHLWRSSVSASPKLGNASRMRATGMGFEPSEALEQAAFKWSQTATASMAITTLPCGALNCCEHCDGPDCNKAPF